jgi:hypothetical protein
LDRTSAVDGHAVTIFLVVAVVYLSFFVGLNLYLRRRWRLERERDERRRQFLEDARPVRATNSEQFAQRYFGQFLHASPESGPTTTEWGEANALATQLMLSTLTPVQRRQMQTYGRFAVIGSHGGIYAVSNGDEQVFSLSERAYYCFQPVDRWTPDGDRTLAYKLWIEAKEEDFLSRANAFSRRPVDMSLVHESEVRATLNYNRYVIDNEAKVIGLAHEVQAERLTAIENKVAAKMGRIETMRA